MYAVRIGFVALLDAAPLIAAQELGFFAQENVQTQLVRQPGWRAVGDGLNGGWLDVSQVLLGMSAMSEVGRDGFVEPMPALMSLSRGGSCIVVSNRLAQADVLDPAPLAAFARSAHAGRALACGFPANSGTLHYLLRDWLAQGGPELSRDAHVMQLTPAGMLEHIAKGYIDIFCAPEPWGLLAQRDGVGRVAACTVDVVPDHPEKLLAARESFIQKHSSELPRMLRAILRGCRYCSEPANYPQLAAMLARDEYLAQPAELLLQSLCIGPQSLGGEALVSSRSPGWRFRSFNPQESYPSATHIVWLLSQMMRWGEIPAGFDAIKVARRSVRAEFFREAAGSLGLTTPAGDFPDMPLKHGTLSVEQTITFDTVAAAPAETKLKMPA